MSEGVKYEAVDLNTGAATPEYAVYAYEPGKQWIVCTGMYRWTAEQLADHLNRTQPRWTRP